MLREAVLEGVREDAPEEVQSETRYDPQLTRRLLRAVETYKASCLAAGEEPTTEDSWLVLLSALQLEDEA